MSSTSSISSPMVSASRPPQSIGVEGSRLTEPPCEGSRSSDVTHRLARTPANWRWACWRCLTGVDGLRVLQNESRSDPADQSKNSDSLSTHSAIWVSWASVNFVLPLPCWAHCAPQKPTVRGQFSPPHSISTMVTEHGFELTQPEATSVITSENVPAPTVMQRVTAPLLQA